MIKIALELSGAGYWPITKIKLQEHFILIHYLITDVFSQASKWIDWVNDPETIGGSPNATFLLKDPDTPDEVLLCDALDRGDIEDIPHFIIKKNNFIELLKKWDELYMQRVPYIVLTIEDNGVSIEGKESLEKCAA